MPTLALLPLLFLVADEAPWKLAAERDRVKVYAREHAGSAVREMKAVGLVDAPPLEVWRVVRDYEAYPVSMPYTVEAKVLRRSAGDEVMLVYNRLEPPMVSSRDYLITITDESDWRDGRGFLKSSWTAAGADADALLPERQGVVRVRLNDGYWLLEPREAGRKTLATYSVYTAPGGAVPPFAANAANRVAVPRVFAAIRKAVAAPRAR
jgi:hypothetical protein